MNNFRLCGLPLILIAVATAATAAQAQDVGLTRAQVVAELHEAQAAGIVPHGDLDITARNGGPDDSPARTAVSTATRAQVQAELAQAVKAGDVMVGDNSRTLAEIEPSHYPLPVPAPGLTRAEVRAQLAEAVRLGDIQFGDTGKTMAEQFPQRYAAARAEEIREQQARYVAARALATAPTQTAAGPSNTSAH